MSKFKQSINELQKNTIAKLRKTLQWSDSTDVIVRKDGQDYRFEADWLRTALDILYSQEESFDFAALKILRKTTGEY